MDKKIDSRWRLAVGRFAFLVMVFFAALFAKAQESTSKKEVVDMATGMRSNGKIYVVVAVLCVILAGVFVYLINLDKKITKLEKEETSRK